MQKYLSLFDLDWTLRKPKSDSEFINDPDDQELLPGVYQKLESLEQENYLVGITNQKGASLGYKTLTKCIQEQCNTIKLLPFLDSILFCPDDGEKCRFVTYSDEINDFECIDISDEYLFLKGLFRKPYPGMLLAAMAIYEKSPSDTLFVGDHESDKLAAEAVKVSFNWATAL